MPRLETRAGMWYGNGMPGVSPIDKPRIRGKAVRLLAEGNSLAAVGRELGVGKDTVWRWTKREDVQREVQAQAAQILELAPEAVDTYKRALDDAKHVEVVPHLVQYEVDDPENPGTKKTIAVPADPKDRAVNVKIVANAQAAARDILQTAGILASHTESRVMIAILGNDAVEALSPAIGQLMGAMTQSSAEPEAIDITPEEEE